MRDLPGFPKKEFLVSETEWYDRILFALGRLSQRPGVKEHWALVDGSVAAYVGDDPQVHRYFTRQWKEAPSGAEPAGWAYVFTGLKDPEYLRRLNEYPDETLQVDLEAPFMVYCQETNSLVTVNARYNI